MTDGLAYPFADTLPDAGALVPVADGVHWLRMPLPFALDHINLWVVDDGPDGVALIDTGVASDETRALWDAVLSGPLAGRTVTRVICTHFHPDHMGLSGWLCARLGVALWATLGEWAFGRQLSLDNSPDYVATQVAFYRQLGFSDAQVAGLRARGNSYAARIMPLPDSVHRMIDDDVIAIGSRDWRVIVGRGHSPEHASLYCPALNVLISGDQVLPRISPNVSVWPQEPEADPLALFMASLRRICDIVPPDALVLPSHGRPFTGLHGRIAELLEHHDDRLSDTLEACTGTAHSAVELVPVLFRRQLDDHQMFFAVGEALAHLHALERTGAVDRVTGDDGVIRFGRR